MTATLPVVRAVRYVAPLREGGSLPAIMEADDLGTYVAKFRGAGQGLPVLVAEVIVGELARALGLRTPRLVGLTVPAELTRYEADEEVQDLLKASVGLNLGVDFLPRSFAFDPTAALPVEVGAPALWLDAFVANVDRTWRNPNLLVWHEDVWLIDHGAALYFHHGWSGGIGDPARFAAQPYDITDHCLARFAPRAHALGDELAARAEPLLEGAVAAVPDEWLEPRPGAPTPDAIRAAYLRFLRARLAGGRPWTPRAADS